MDSVPDMDPLQILLVEVQPDIVDVLCKYLKSLSSVIDFQKLEIKSATNIAQAQNMMTEDRFEVVIVDPVVSDSQKSIKKIQKIHAVDQHTAIILLSDNEYPEWAQQSIGLNIKGYLSYQALDGRMVRQMISTALIKSRQKKRSRAVENKYKDIIHNLPDAYFELSLSGKYLYVNKASERHFDRTIEELSKMDYRDLYPERQHKPVLEMYIKMYTGEIGPQVYGSELLKRDGSSFFIEIAVAVMKGKNGKPIGFFGISRDVTEKKIAQEKLRVSEEKHRTILENMEDAYYEMDFDGHLTFFSDSLCTMLGYRKEELTGIHISKYIDQKTIKRTDKIFAQIIKTKTPQMLQYDITRKDGATRYHETTAALVLDKDGNALGFRGVSRDLTQRLETMEALKKAKKEAEMASQAKSEFLANMSHEIRTPMNGVLGMYNLLFDTDMTDEQADYVVTGKRSAEGLLSVINDILDFSKIEAGKLDIEIIDFDLRRSIDEIVTLPAVQAHTKGLEFICEIGNDVPTLIKGDPGRIRQIIMNLCTNAIKFTHKGEIYFKIGLEKETKTHINLRLSIQDTGIGISAKDQKRLFSSFEQVDASTTRKYGGTGLGLAISKNLVELMDGKIGLKSTPGKGSEFFFNLSFEKQPDMEERSFENIESIQNKRILIVDDNQTNLNILSRYLSYWGCSSDNALSGDMALSLMHAVAKAGAPYDIVISDMLMPEMDGAQLGKIIKADPKLKSTPMVMFTSQGLRGDASRMKSIGFAGYLSKPVRRSLLYDCLMMVLNQSLKGVQPKKEEPLITSYRISEEKKKNLNILLAEDNKINQKVALSLLKKFGLKADPVENGRLAIEALEQKEYQIVLMDVQMPEMDGLTATKIIRDPKSKVKNHDVVIIAMTAHAMKQDREMCLNAGMNDYISKPIKPKTLLEIIEKNIQQII